MTHERSDRYMVDMAAALEQELAAAVAARPLLANDLREAHADAAAFEATVKDLGGRMFASPDRRLMPEELRQARFDAKEGFLFLVEFPDRKGTTARCFGLQSGRFWPALKTHEEGKGAEARNVWAAKHAAEVYQRMRGARP